MSFSALSTTAQTAYAQLQDAALAEYVSRTVADVAGSFARKTVNGQRYWYFAFREGAAVRQIYVGPDSERVRRLIEVKKAAPAPSPVQILARAYAAHGATTVLSKHIRVIRRMADYGFFHCGGVLVGTHAFAGYANMLGVKWAGGDRTMDVDLAVPGPNISIAFPTAPVIDLHDALTTFEAGFLPGVTIDGGIGPTYRLKGEPDFRVDFLTTLSRNNPVARKLESLSVAAAPLKFMDYLLERSAQTVLIDDAGRFAVVTVPGPARYGVHKVMIQGERGAQYATKVRKDLEQAAALFKYFAHHDPDTLQAAWDDAARRGRGWSKRLSAGLTALARLTPLEEIGLIRDGRGARLRVQSTPQPRARRT